MPHYDIAIIGAGPSGSTCALALHGSGLKVALIDKDDFPRDKICGDAIPGPAFKVLNLINDKWCSAIKDLTQKEIVNSSKGFAPNGKTIRFNWKAYSYNCKRMDFDNSLFDLVGKATDTTILTGKRIKQLEQIEKGILCHFHDNSVISASLVIGCDGANSIVSRQLIKDSPKKEDISTAVRAYYKGVIDVESGVNEFHFFDKITPGYFWIFPLANGWVNVGLGIVKSRKNKDHKLNLRKVLEQVITSYPTIAPRFKNAQLIDKIKGFSLPLCIKKEPISGERFMLCGDAASLISPLWGHGIDTGMWSGYYAAQQVRKCFSTDNFSAGFMLQYDDVVYQKIAKGFIKNARVLRLIQRFPKMLNIFWASMRFGRTIKWLSRILRF